jgi:hypothetical protein
MPNLSPTPVGDQAQASRAGQDQVEAGPAHRVSPLGETLLPAAVHFRHVPLGPVQMAGGMKGVA